MKGVTVKGYALYDLRKRLCAFRQWHADLGHDVAIACLQPPQVRDHRVGRDFSRVVSVLLRA